jgi:hypothetical protein
VSTYVSAKTPPRCTIASRERGSRVRPPAHPTQSPKRLGAALIALALALSCTNGAEVRPLSPRAGLGAGAAGTTRLELRSLPERPVLAALVREGDPTAALALTLAMHADVAALAALGELLVSDLEAAGARSTLRVDRSSLTLVVAADAKSGAALFAAILGRLSRPLPTTAPSAKVRGRVADRLAAIPVEGAAAEVRLRGCLGQAGAAAPLALDLASAAGMQRVEAARRAAFTRERAAFAVVGPEAVASAIEGALERGEPWASSPAPTRGAEPPVAAASQTPRVGSGGARLHVAVRAADPLAAIAAARAPRAEPERARRSRRTPRLPGGSRRRGRRPRRRRLPGADPRARGGERGEREARGRGGGRPRPHDP